MSRTLLGIVVLLVAAVGAARAGWMPDSSNDVVARVIDGDTVEMRNGDVVRLAGIDTPETGQCGFAPASDNLARLVEGRDVRLVATPGDDADHYGRLVRYVYVGEVDAGREQIADGYAVARYDSRDGYDRHPNEADYHRLTEATTHVCG